MSTLVKWNPFGELDELQNRLGSFFYDGFPINAFKKLRIPTFVSTEHATEWGSHLNAEQHTLLVKAQRALSYTAAEEPNLQLKVNLSAQSKLMREAAGAFALSWAA